MSFYFAKKGEFITIIGNLFEKKRYNIIIFWYFINIFIILEVKIIFLSHPIIISV